MSNFAMKFSFLLTFLTCAVYASGKGGVSLNSNTFDKIVPKFKATLVKFDVTYPYGEKHDEYVKVAEESKNTADLLIADVGVQDYGDKENMDLAERFDVKKDDFPVVKLFIQGKEEPLTFSGDFKADELKAFVKKNSGVKLNLDKCLPQFDDIVTKFMKSDNKAEQEKLLKEAQGLAEKLEKEAEKKSGDVYIKMMQKVLERGKPFIDSETERVKNIKNGKITATKKEELQGRLNILQSFNVKEEL